MRPPRIPNWLPGDADTIYFLTLCVEGRHAVLDNPAAWNLCREVWRRLDRWHIHAAIAMPDHLHLLLSPLGDRYASLSAWMKWFKRWFNEGYAEICRASVPDALDCRASVPRPLSCSASVPDAELPSHRDGLQGASPSRRDGPQSDGLQHAFVGRLGETPSLKPSGTDGLQSDGLQHALVGCLGETSSLKPSGTDGLQGGGVVGRLGETPKVMPWRWMEGGFDHLLRSNESAQEKWNYMRLNPVRAGLVKRPEDWPYQMGLGEVL